MLTSSLSDKDIEKSKTYSNVKGFHSKLLTLEKVLEILREFWKQ